MKNYKSALLFFISSTALALDIPVPYRAARFQGTPSSTSQPFHSTIMVLYGEGKTEKGYDTHGTAVPFLSNAGSINVNLLASNLDNLTSTNFPLTYSYLRTNGGTIPSLGFSGKDGTVDLEGSFRVQEWNFSGRMNLLKGFFIEALVPLKTIHSSGVTIKNKTNSSTPGATTFQNFLENNFDAVLQEHGYKSLSSSFKRTGIGDCCAFFGWRGFSENAFGIVKDVTGELSIGGHLPFAAKNHEKYVTEIPLGYDQHWGVSGKARAQTFFCDYGSLGAYADVTVFFPSHPLIRMKTDPSQSGIIMFERGRAHVNKGAVWQAGAYVGAHALKRALSLIAGFSYTQQEKTELQVDDPDFLSTFLTAQDNDTSIIVKSSQDQVVNSAKNLEPWFMGTVHLLLSYNACNHFKFKFSPVIQFFYDIPVDGALVYKNKFLGGGGGISVSFDF